MEPLLITTGSVVAEQLRAPKSLVFLISRVWVQVPAVTLVSLSDTQNHDALSFGSDQSILIENAKLNPLVLFRTTPTHSEIIITWCYHKPL